MADTPAEQHSLGLEDLRRLNRIAEQLNRSVDVQTALQGALTQLVELMGLKTAWLFLRKADARDIWSGRGFELAAHCNLPPALHPESEEAWKRGCDCQGLCDKGQLNAAYNEVKCSRLAAVSGDREGLRVHASAPLRSGDSILGILNVACESWDSFDPRSLALLSNAGSLIGVALERARLYDALQAQRLDEQEALLGLSRQLLESPDLGALLALIAMRTAELGQAQASAVLMATEAEQTWSFRETFGWRTLPDRLSLDCDEPASRPLCQALREQQVQTLLLQEDGGAGKEAGLDWLRQEGLRALAILPLTVGDETVGGLLLGRRTATEFSQDTLRFLRLIADHAALAVDKARLYEQALAQQELEKELAVARHIQESFLPAELPQVDGWQVAARYQSARQIGGDFYDAFELPDGRLGFVVADVMGKGVPAALFMAMARTIIRTTALSGRDPAAALIRANELILKDSDADRFLSAMYAALDPASSELEYALAGHNPPLLVSAKGDVAELPAGGRVLGLFDEVPIELRSLQMAPGSTLLAYTDGVSEAQDEEGELFELDGLWAAVTDGPNTPAELIDRVTAAVHEFHGGQPQADDITLLAIHRRANEIPGS